MFFCGWVKDGFSSVGCFERGIYHCLFFFRVGLSCQDGSGQSIARRRSGRSPMKVPGSLYFFDCASGSFGLMFRREGTCHTHWPRADLRGRNGALRLRGSALGSHEVEDRCPFLVWSEIGGAGSDGFCSICRGYCFCNKARRPGSAALCAKNKQHQNKTLPPKPGQLTQSFC